MTPELLALFETVIDEVVQRAIARHTPQDAQTPAPMWVGAKEASTILGEGYPPARVKELGRRGEVVMDRKDPDKPLSDCIFLRSSLHDYSARRVFQLDQGRPKGLPGAQSILNKATSRKPRV